MFRFGLRDLLLAGIQALGRQPDDCLRRRRTLRGVVSLSWQAQDPCRVKVKPGSGALVSRIEAGKPRLELIEHCAKCGNALTLLRNHRRRSAFDEFRVCEFPGRLGQFGLQARDFLS